MAKPTPLQIGRADPHILQSRGAENYIMNFYVTNYSTSFTKPSIENDKSKLKDIPVYSGSKVFKPRSAPQYHDTGYTANVRPQIYYETSLDDYDNPEMGLVCMENYRTITHTDYQPYKLKDGFEELPAQVLDQTSAYTQTAYNHNPRPAEVSDLFINTRIKAPYDVLPKHRTRLEKVTEHDPIKNENYGFGPKYMSTEYSAKYPKPKPNEIEKNHAVIGPKESSGYSDNKEKEDTLTGVPGERWNYLNRPTGVSDYKDKFLPYVFPKSETHLPNISNFPITKESTFSKAYRPSDINPKRLDFKKPSEYKDNYLGKQRNDPIQGQNLGTAVVGQKEETGNTRNEHAFVQTLDDPRRFITNYQMRHYDMNPKGKDREGHLSGGIQKIVDDGYSVNVKIHEPGNINPSADLMNMDSYQSRSIRARDTFYDDNNHSHKLTLKEKVVTFQDNNPYSVKMHC